MTVFHSGHLSHLLKLSDQPYRRQKTLTTGDFSGNLFLTKSFPTPTIPSGAQGGDLQVFSKHRREILTHAPPNAFLLRRPESHVPAREGAWSTFRPCTSTSNLAWRRLATLHLCLCHPSPASAFFGVFCLRRPSKQPFQRPPVTSSPPRALHVS